MRDRATRRKGIILVLVSAISWGFSGCCGQFLGQNHSIDPLYVSAVRMIVGAAILMAYEVLFRRKQLVAFLRERRMWPRLLLYAVLGIIACQVTYLEGITYTNAAVGTMMEQIALPIVLVVTCLRKRRLPHWREVVALLFALIGALLITTHLDFSSLAIPFIGLLWGIASAIACACYLLLPGPLLKRYSSWEVTSVGMAVAALVTIPTVRPWTYDVTFSGEVLFGLAGMAVIGTALAYMAFVTGIKDAGTVPASLINSSELVWAAIIQAVWLGTPLTGYDVVGLVFIFAMAVLISLDSD